MKALHEVSVDCSHRKPAWKPLGSPTRVSEAARSDAAPRTCRCAHSRESGGAHRPQPSARANGPAQDVACESSEFCPSALKNCHDTTPVRHNVLFPSVKLGAAVIPKPSSSTLYALTLSLGAVSVCTGPASHRGRQGTAVGVLTCPQARPIPLSPMPCGHDRFSSRASAPEACKTCGEREGKGEALLVNHRLSPLINNTGHVAKL